MRLEAYINITILEIDTLYQTVTFSTIEPMVFDERRKITIPIHNELKTQSVEWHKESLLGRSGRVKVNIDLYPPAEGNYTGYYNRVQMFINLYELGEIRK